MPHSPSFEIVGEERRLCRAIQNLFFFENLFPRAELKKSHKQTQFPLKCAPMSLKFGKEDITNKGLYFEGIDKGDMKRAVI